MLAVINAISLLYFTVTVFVPRLLRATLSVFNNTKDPHFKRFLTDYLGIDGCVIILLIGRCAELSVARYFYFPLFFLSKNSEAFAQSSSLSTWKSVVYKIWASLSRTITTEPFRKHKHKRVNSNFKFSSAIFICRFHVITVIFDLCIDYF